MVRDGNECAKLKMYAILSVSNILFRWDALSLKWADPPYVEL
jgi:hypothetical protein